MNSACSQSPPPPVSLSNRSGSGTATHLDAHSSSTIFAQPPATALTTHQGPSRALGTPAIHEGGGGQGQASQCAQRVSVWLVKRDTSVLSCSLVLTPEISDASVLQPVFPTCTPHDPFEGVR